MARVRTVRRVSESGNWAFMTAFPVRPAVLTVVMDSRVVGLRRLRQSPKPLAAKDFWPCQGTAPSRREVVLQVADT